MRPRTVIGTERPLEQGSSSQVVHRFERLYNFRDIGGLNTVDGRTMKPGVLFRSDELSRMSDRDLAKLQELDIKLICDLRSPRESRRKRLRAAPNLTIPVVNIPIHEQPSQDGSGRRLFSFLFGKAGEDRFREFSRRYYHHIAFEQTSRIRVVITLLAKEDQLPAVIHCTAGKDRTGFLAAVIQLLVGIPYDVVMKEYLLTNDYFGPRLENLIKVVRILTLFQVSSERMRLVLMAHPESLDEVHDLIVKNHGSIEAYLCTACGIDRDTLQNVKARLLA